MSNPILDSVACVRCGRKRRTRSGRPVAPLCADCVMVARDLGELEIWTKEAA